MTSKRAIDAWYDETIKEPTELLVFMAICDEADERGLSRPRLIDISKKARCDERTVKRKIKSLIEKGKIKSTRRFGTSNEYQIIDKDKMSSSPENSIRTQSPHLSDKLSPHSISVLKDSGIKGVSINNAIPEKAPGIAAIVKTFDPDEIEKPKKTKPPKKTNHIKMLEPQTKGERILFGLLQAEITATRGPGWKVATRFPSKACKDMFDEMEGKLNGELQTAINSGLRKGILSVDGMVSWVHGWKPKEKAIQSVARHEA